MARTNQDGAFKSENRERRRHHDRQKLNQYFTPETVVKKALSLLPEIEPEAIIDPAVGEGAFLSAASELWQTSSLFGIDIDRGMIHKIRSANAFKAHLYCSNSLERQTWENAEIAKVLSKGGFDLVLGNPPFSSWFDRIKAPEALRDFCLAHNNKKLRRGQAIEVLFLEKFISLARANGHIVIILPDGILSNPQYAYVRQFILAQTKVHCIISLPRHVFRDTSAKTSILILKKSNSHNLHYSAKLCRFQSPGIIGDPISLNGIQLRNRMDWEYHHKLNESNLHLLLRKGFKFVPLSQFVTYCKTGKTLYGKERNFASKGARFLHATNITELGIDYERDKKFIDPKSKMYSPEAHVRVGELVFVRVGVGCAGRIAMVDSKEKEGVASDYLHIFGVTGIDPFFLVAYLKTRFGQDSISLLKHGVGTVSINKTDLLSLPIPIVPIQIQQAISVEFKRILADHDSEEQIRDQKIKNVIDHLENQLLNYGKEIQDAQATAN